MKNDLYANKNILIFLPHEDDEINLVYGLLDGIKNKNCNVKVVYSTNGDYVVKAKYRIKEAIDSLKLVGIKKENIIFMGYSDQAYENPNHLYQSSSSWTSKNGIKKTYTPTNNDYHYLKYHKHAEFNRENFINDIYNILKEEMADVIICVDYDAHPDHRALSLAFEHALGKILNESDYRPIVYKCFAYQTSYMGLSDYNYNNPSTKNNQDINSITSLGNPYYNWSKRKRFCQSSKALRKMLFHNIYYRGLLKHKSQYILNVFDKVINSDIVFFERLTHNLLYQATIKTSSGDSKYLNDFLLFDSSNIMFGNSKKPVYDKGYMKFKEDDNLKTINVNFTQKENFNYIKIYVSLSSDKIDSLIVKYNNKKEELIPEFNNNVYTIKKNFANVDNIEIRIVSSGKSIMIGELEIYKEINLKNTYAKLMINDNFVYRWFSKEKVNFNIYTNYDQNKLRIKHNKNKYQLLDENDNILDEVIIENKKIYEIKIKIIKIINKLTILVGRIYQKLIKMRRQYFL